MIHVGPNELLLYSYKFIIYYGTHPIGHHEKEITKGKKNSANIPWLDIDVTSD